MIHDNPSNLNALEQALPFVCRKAVILKWLVPISGFTEKMALVCAGMDYARLNHHDTVTTYEWTRKVCQQEHGGPCYSDNKECLQQRYQWFVQYATKWPLSSEIKKGLENIDLSKLSNASNVERSAAIRLVGGGEDKTHGSFYMSCKRWEKKSGIFREKRVGRGEAVSRLNPFEDFPKVIPPSISTNNSSAVMAMAASMAASMTSSTANSQQSNPIIHFNSEQGRGRFLQSPLPTEINRVRGNGENISPMGSEVSRPSFGSSISNEPELRSIQERPNVSFRQSQSSTDSSIRRTAQQASDLRRDECNEKLERAAAYKVGTVLVDLLKRDQLPHYESPAEVVSVICNHVIQKPGIISAREITKAVNEGRINEMPPQQGTRGRLPEGAFEALSDLLFSLNCISQHNSDKALDRSQLIQLVSTLIEPYFLAKGENSMDARRLWKRIEEQNAYRQDMNFRDSRELIRFNWFTVTNMIKHYDNTFAFLVKHGFARKATPAEIQLDGEPIKWLPNQKQRGMNFDEISFGLDKDANGLGGREACTFTFKNIRDSGETDQHSSWRCTLLLGMNYADEAMPGLLILPSAADSPKIYEGLLQEFHQVFGQFGHNRRKGFDFMIASSTKGSMTKGILERYIEKLIQLYPDAKDEINYKLFFKVDSGPGRSDEAFLTTARQYGLYCYPGCPNTSEGTQEMDQGFSYAKGLMEMNRRKIFEAKDKHNAGQVSFFDLPYIIFGGTFKLPDQTTLELPNAFETAFDSAHLRRMREKCGYCPANRNALFHRKCRRELGDDVIEEATINGFPANNDDLDKRLKEIESKILECGESGDSRQAYSDMINSIQEMNINACENLQNLGFDLAYLGRRNVSEENENEDDDMSARPSIRTIPGTRARQDILQNAKRLRAGDFFRITNGGDALNCDDMLMALERKKMNENAIKLKKLKVVMAEREKLVLDAKAIMDNGGPKTNPERKICIQWKSKKATKPTGNKDSLMSKWNRCKNLPIPGEKKWTEQHQRKLQQLETGDISQVKDGALFRRAFARKCTFLGEQMKILGEEEIHQMVLFGYSLLSDSMQTKTKEGIKKIDSGNEFSPGCFNYDLDLDNFDNSSCDESSLEEIDEDDDVHHISNRVTDQASLPVVSNEDLEDDCVSSDRNSDDESSQEENEAEEGEEEEQEEEINDDDDDDNDSFDSNLLDDEETDDSSDGSFDSNLMSEEGDENCRERSAGAGDLAPFAPVIRVTQNDNAGAGDLEDSGDELEEAPFAPAIGVSQNDNAGAGDSEDGDDELEKAPFAPAIGVSQNDGTGARDSEDGDDELEEAPYAPAIGVSQNDGTGAGDLEDSGDKLEEAPFAPVMLGVSQHDGTGAGDLEDSEDEKENTSNTDNTDISSKYDVMSRDELIEECIKVGLKADKRNSKITLLKRMKAFVKDN